MCFEGIHLDHVSKKCHVKQLTQKNWIHFTGPTHTAIEPCHCTVLKEQQGYCSLFVHGTFWEDCPDTGTNTKLLQRQQSATNNEINTHQRLEWTERKKNEVWREDNDGSLQRTYSHRSLILTHITTREPGAVDPPTESSSDQWRGAQRGGEPLGTDRYKERIIRTPKKACRWDSITRLGCQNIQPES